MLSPILGSLRVAAGSEGNDGSGMLGAGTGDGGALVLVRIVLRGSSGRRGSSGTGPAAGGTPGLSDVADAEGRSRGMALNRASPAISSGPLPLPFVCATALEVDDDAAGAGTAADEADVVDLVNDPSAELLLLPLRCRFRYCAMTASSRSRIRVAMGEMALDAVAGTALLREVLAAESWPCGRGVRDAAISGGMATSTVGGFAGEPLDCRRRPDEEELV